MTTKKRICFIAGGHISSTPRLIKEADLLHSKGFEVLVLSPQMMESIVQFDQKIYVTRKWKTYDIPLYQRSLVSKFIGKLSKSVVRKGLFKEQTGSSDYIKVVAPWYKSFLGQIECFKPDLIIAHSISALTVAAFAKKRYGIPFGFDVEDYHAAECVGGMDDFSNALGFHVMKLCLPEALYATISSPQIAEQMHKHFRVENEEVVLNAFPLENLKHKEVKRSRPSFYWFSQSIGLDRGLPDILEACDGLRGDFELHLRGGCSDSVRNQILGYANKGRFQDRLFLDPRCGADELLSESMNHDIGLALEYPTPLNRDLCITNKILMYAVAGLALAATGTAGQRWVMDQMPGAGFVYEPGNVSSLRNHLQSWLDNPQALADAKLASRRAAEARFSWDHESVKFLNLIDRVVV